MLPDNVGNRQGPVHLVATGRQQYLSWLSPAECRRRRRTRQEQPRHAEEKPPPGAGTSVVSTFAHDPFTFSRTGCALVSVVIVPSGFTHVVVVSVSSPATSIRCFKSLAATRADARSGRVNVSAVFGAAAAAAKRNSRSGGRWRRRIRRNGNGGCGQRRHNRPDEHRDKSKADEPLNTHKKLPEVSNRFANALSRAKAPNASTRLIRVLSGIRDATREADITRMALKVAGVPSPWPWRSRMRIAGRNWGANFHATGL